MLKLYGYYRSSASYRVRIALALKGLEVETVPVNLLAGAQQQPDYLVKNPQGLVPSLVTEGGALLTQSLAILEYLEETHPHPPLLPVDPVARARVRALALAIACEIAPINNLRVIRYVAEELGGGEAGKTAWIRHWMGQGLQAVEALLAESDATGTFCHGDIPTLADCCLVPQIYNARRFEVALEPYPTINRIVEACEALPAFRYAHPDAQPDKPPA